MFAQTTHVIAAPRGFARHSYIFQTISKSVQRFRIHGGWNGKTWTLSYMRRACKRIKAKWLGLP